MPVEWIEPVAEASVLQWLHDGRRGRSALFVALDGEREPGVTGAKFDSVRRASVFTNGGEV